RLAGVLAALARLADARSLRLRALEDAAHLARLLVAQAEALLHALDAPLESSLAVLGAQLAGPLLLLGREDRLHLRAHALPHLARRRSALLGRQLPERLPLLARLRHHAAHLLLLRGRQPE